MPKFARFFFYSPPTNAVEKIIAWNTFLGGGNFSLGLISKLDHFKKTFPLIPCLKIHYQVIFRGPIFLFLRLSLKVNFAQGILRNA